LTEAWMHSFVILSARESDVRDIKAVWRELRAYGLIESGTGRSTDLASRNCPILDL